MFSHKLNRTLGLIILFMGALLWTSSVQSAPGSLATSPIFTNSNVPPNVFFEVDDSGSMDFEVMTSSHWSYCAYDRDATSNTGNADCGYRVISGHSSISTTNFDPEAWQSEVLNIFDEPDNLYYDLCINTLDNCSNTETMVDWRLYSTDLNTVYYDPSIEYKPWYGASFSNASFISALSNPQPGSNGYADSGGTPITRNLSNGITTGANTGFIYEIWQDTHGYSGTRPRRGSNINRNTTSNNEVDLWDNHTRYYVQLSQIVEQSISYTVSSTGTLTENIDSTTTYSGSDTLNGRTIAEVQQNIANWYQYSRRRSFVTKGALGKVIIENPENRYGLNFINNSSFDYNSGSSSFINVPTGLAGFSSHNNSLLQGLYDLEWAALSTPLREGLDRAGQYFDDSSSSAPIEYECQQNFAVLLTDGYWNGSTQSTTIGNKDGDSHSDTISDIAKYYYDEDLSTKPNNVPPNSEDLKTTQHLVTFPVAFGVNGLLPDADNDGWPEDSSSVKLTESGDWGDPESSYTTPEKIDDLWHAAFNSKGRFASASTPVELENALANAIGSAGSLRGSVAAVNFNTTSLSSDTDVYVAEFDKTDNLWKGDLTSYDLDPTSGAIATSSNWTAATQLDAMATPDSSRKIITYNNATGNGIPFQWTNLTTNQKDDLKIEPDGSSSDITKAQEKLNFLRGDRSNEQLNTGSYTFRNRASLLGDIVNSAPAFVKLPNDDWPAISPFPSTTGEKYSDFQSTQSARDGVIYVGANDGMLHGFSEATGEELISYIPNYLFSNTSSSEGLHFLTDLNYRHRYYVDLSPIVSDVYIDKATSGGSNKHWVSLLVGGSRAGGRGVFALDVTNPGSFSEANAADIVLWEFTDADDADLGFIFSPPTIAMMNNGRWAAIFGNGYNNQGDGKAKLFIVFLNGGVDGVWTPTTDYIEIDTGVGSIVSNDCLDSASDCNGLSIPEAVDLDGNHTIDRVYAGDIKGNLWAFDLSNATASNWGSAYPTSGGTAKPLFIASSSQPIMDKPISVKHPDIADNSSPSNIPNRLVFFGTGQYLSNSDVTTIPGTQSFYGVWDHGTEEITPANLFEQHFDTSTTFLDNEDDCATVTGPCTDTDNNLTNSIRVFNNDLNSNGTIDSNEKIDYLGTASHQGWKINLTLSAGERVIYNPRVYDGLVIFETIIPEAIACSTGGSGYLMVVNQKDGGAPDINDPAFDLSGDGEVDSDDLVKDSTNKTSAVVGKKREHGMGGQSNMQGDKLYTSITDGGIEIDSFRVSSNLGRLSWQELR
jgi:type IV pilus assembly protein PilY1